MQVIGKLPHKEEKSEIVWCYGLEERIQIFRAVRDLQILESTFC